MALPVFSVLAGLNAKGRRMDPCVSRYSPRQHPALSPTWLSLVRCAVRSLEQTDAGLVSLMSRGLSHAQARRL
jgi:hypothetical protein